MSQTEPSLVTHSLVYNIFRLPARMHIYSYSTRPIEGLYCNVAKIAFQCAARAIFAVQLGFYAKSAQNTSRFRWVCTVTIYTSEKPAAGLIPAAGFSDWSAKSSEYVLNRFISS